MCVTTEPPVVSPDAFDNPESITVHVSLSSSSVEAYENAESWRIFKEVVGIDDLPKKCATPVITYENGKVTFTCETEGVEFVSVITCPDNTGEYYCSTIDLKRTFNISVYARKADHENSDYATMQITLTGREASGVLGDINNDNKVNGVDIQEIINIIVEEEK